ncbi:MAG: hypothetical protein QW512_01585 [Thermofilaceae archaeon]
MALPTTRLAREAGVTRSFFEAVENGNKRSGLDEDSGGDEGGVGDASGRDGADGPYVRPEHPNPKERLHGAGVDLQPIVPKPPKL